MFATGEHFVLTFYNRLLREIMIIKISKKCLLYILH